MLARTVRQNLSRAGHTLPFAGIPIEKGDVSGTTLVDANAHKVATLRGTNRDDSAGGVLCCAGDDNRHPRSGEQIEESAVRSGKERDCTAPASVEAEAAAIILPAFGDQRRIARCGADRSICLRALRAAC